MYYVELSQEERGILNQILHNSLATLELEIQHTDHQEFKNQLKHRREVLQTLAAKMWQPMAVAA
jgi:hypothetical protein